MSSVPEKTKRDERKAKQRKNKGKSPRTDTGHFGPRVDRGRNARDRLTLRRARLTGYFDWANLVDRSWVFGFHP